MMQRDFSSVSNRDAKTQESQEAYILATLSAIRSSCERSAKFKDPVVRYVSFLEKLLTITDIGMALLKTLKYKENCSFGLSKEIDETTELFKTQVECLLDWIQLPQLDPDNLEGSKLMENALSHFNENKHHGQTQ